MGPLDKVRTSVDYSYVQAELGDLGGVILPATLLNTNFQFLTIGVRRYARILF